MRILLVLISSLITLTTLAAEEMIATAVVYDMDGKEKKFLYERFEDIQGDKVIDRSVYKDLDGEVLVEEKMVTNKGELVRYDIEQKQLKQTAWIETSPGKVTYNLKKFRKNNYPQTEDKPDNLLLPMQITPFVKNNWDHFMAGKSKDIQLGVWHRQEHLGFELSVDKEQSNKERLVVKMAPSSFLIKAIVSPLYFYFDKSTKSLKEYKGRTAPKEKKGRSYNNFDGLTKYTSVKKK